MKSRLLIIGLTTFLAAAAFVTFMNLRHCPHALRRLSRTLLHMKYKPASDIAFRWNGVQGYNSQGPRGSTSDGSGFESSDCVTVGWAAYRFPTQADADAQFQEWTTSGSKILEITNPASEITRAVLQINDKEDFKYPFEIILKRKGSKKIVSIWSKSLDHAVLLEKQLKLEDTASAAGANAVGANENLAQTIGVRRSLRCCWN